MSAEGSKMSEGKLLNVDEVARRLNVPKTWLYGRIHSRNLPFPHLKIGHYLRFREQDIQEYIENCISYRGRT